MAELWQAAIDALMRDRGNEQSAALLQHIAEIKSALFNAQVTVREQAATIQRLEAQLGMRLDGGGWDRAQYDTEAHEEDVHV